MPTSYDIELAKTAGKPRSPHWPSVRAAWLKDHGECRGCGTTQSLEVHHKKPFHLHPELELDPSNFITLCEMDGHDCHFRLGHGYDWKLFNERVEEDAAHELERLKAIREGKRVAAVSPYEWQRWLDELLIWMNG